MAVRIMWFRRDLRLGDNPALRHAAQEGTTVVPVFIVDQCLVKAAGPHRQAFVAGSLAALDRSMDGSLVVRTGQPAAALARLVEETGAEMVIAAAEFTPHGTARDEAVVGAGIPVEFVGSPYVVDPGVLLSSSGTPFKVFTPFYKAWRAVGAPPPIARPAKGRVRWASGLASKALPAALRPDKGDPEEHGEDAAHRRLDRFLESRVARYKTDRDRVDLDATSRLSADLHIGTLHPRQVLRRLDGSAGAEKFRAELAWREFYADVLHDRPDSVRADLQPSMEAYDWDTGREADQRFEAWCEGRTGYPLVDAAMRQLLAEGWMPNRARMVAASFLVKDLHVDWRRGAAWFLHWLVDGDVASNQHNWQWVAGTGTDAAPFFRVFNPIKQAKDFDPDGDYARRWIPELTGDPDSYPDPIVDHATERAEALTRYEQSRGRR